MFLCIEAVLTDITERKNSEEALKESDSSELIRVAKKGYIEVPSITVEMTKGVEHRNYSGYCHHKWLVDIEDNK